MLSATCITGGIASRIQIDLRSAAEDVLIFLSSLVPQEFSLIFKVAFSNLKDFLCYILLLLLVYILYGTLFENNFAKWRIFIIIVAIKNIRS